MMLQIEEKEFEKEVLESEQPVLACFTASWCGHCFPTCLVADDLESRYDGRIKFVRIDKEKASGISDKYNITVVPSMILFQDSEISKKLLGYQERASLTAWLDSISTGAFAGDAADGGYR